MIRSVSIPKTSVAANAIYSHKFVEYDTLASMFGATYEYSPVIFFLGLSAFPETDSLTCKINFS